jgi:hypothetical protein
MLLGKMELKNIQSSGLELQMVWYIQSIFQCDREEEKKQAEEPVR